VAGGLLVVDSTTFSKVTEIIVPTKEGIIAARTPPRLVLDTDETAGIGYAVLSMVI
jgi:hypothetical protein